MKHILKTTIAAVLLAGCSESQQSASAPEVKPVAEAAQPTRDTRQTNPQAGPALVDAARAGNLETAKQHLVAGADVDFRNQQGFTPLHVAAQKGHNKVAELLIAKGANVNTTGRLIGTTPLDSAALLGHKEMVELLIDSGADINPQIITGETPLQRAEQRGHSEIAEILRKHGGKAGEVTLQLAIIKSQKDVAKSLITGGADVNAKGLLGRTPLDWAIIGGKNELADLLRKHGGKTSEELKSAELVSEANKIFTKDGHLENFESLTSEEVADLFAGDIGKWAVTEKNKTAGGDTERIEYIFATRWKVEGVSTLSQFSPTINGEKVPFVGHKEYDANQGVFIWRSKGEGLPETVSRERYDRKVKTYHGKLTYPDGAKETSALKIVDKDKRLFNSQVVVDGKVFFSREAIVTRIKTAEELKAEGK